MNMKYGLLLLLLLISFSCSNSKEELSLSGADYTIDLDGEKETWFLQNDMIFKDYENFQSRFIFSDMNGVYVFFNSYFISNFIEHIKKGQFVNGLENVDNLVKLTEESNPVIFYYEYQ